MSPSRIMNLPVHSNINFKRQTFFHLSHFRFPFTFRRFLETLRVELRNSTPRFRSLPEQGNKYIKYFISRMEIGHTTVAFTGTLVPKLHYTECIIFTWKYNNSRQPGNNLPIKIFRHIFEQGGGAQVMYVERAQEVLAEAVRRLLS